MNDSTQQSTPAQQKACAWATLNRTIFKLSPLFDEFQGKTVQRAREAARRTDFVVHHHPYGAIGIAAVTGLVLGLLAARR